MKKNRIIDGLKQNLAFPVTFPLASPRNIIFWVTLRCNGGCSHCFLPGVTRHRINEISKEKIIKIFKTLNRPTMLTLTGGEPFLRKDLLAIACSLMKIPNIEAMRIATNGSFPGKIERICKEIVSRYKKPLCLQVSLDGLAKTHNTIRRIPDGFKKAIATCKKAKELNLQYPHFLFFVNITVTKRNIGEIDRLLDYLKRRKYESLLNPVRGNYFSTFNLPKNILETGYNPREEVEFKIEELERLVKKIDRKYPLYFSPIDRKVLEIAIKTLASRKRQIPCYAGYRDAVIYSNGSVSICEQVKPFGNLSAWDWNFVKAWNSKEAMGYRVKLLFCACIHGCNLYTAVLGQEPTAERLIDAYIKLKNEA